MTIRRDELIYFLHDFLQVDLYQDYCPNGIQVEGQEKIKHVAFSVSASRDSIEKARENKADALIVHHGLFWNHHGAKPLTGAFYQRVAPLIQGKINLLAYHLPLDGHMQVGNAATLAKKLGLLGLKPFGDYKGMPIGVAGEFDKSLAIKTVVKKCEEVLNHSVMFSSSDNEKKIQSLGIITGGASGEWKQAKKAGLDAYLTGEMSEHDWYDSQEAGVCMFAGGHSATESFGIQSLMDVVKETFKIECSFIPSSNPA